MAQTDYNHPKDVKAFAHLQGVSLYQTLWESSTNGEPLATDAFLVPDIKIHDEPPQLLHDDMIGKTGKAKGVLGMRSPAWEIPATSLRPSGTAGTAPSMAFLFRTGIWGDTVYGAAAGTAVAASPASTAIKVHVADASGLTAYEDVVTVANADGELEFALVTGVNTATTDFISITPPLSFVPATGAAVGRTLTYRVTDTCEEPAFDLARFDTHEARKASGCVAQSLKFTWGGNKPPTIEASGFARSIWRAGTTTLASGYTAGGATISPSDHKMYDITPGSVGSICLTIDAEGVNSAESCRATARNASTGALTVEDFDGTALDSNHGAGAVVHPYCPTPTYVGTEIPPKACRVRVGITSTASEVLQSDTGSVSISGGISPRERGHGDEWVVDGFNLSRDLEVKLEAQVWGKKATAAWAMRSLDMEELPVAVSLGWTSGTCVGVVTPRAMFQPFGDGGSGGAVDHIKGTLSGIATAVEGAIGSVAAQVYVAFG